MEEFLKELIQGNITECSTTYKTPQQLQEYNDYIHSKGLTGHLVIYHCDTCKQYNKETPYHLIYVDNGICNNCKYYQIENYIKWENMCKIQELNTWDFKKKCDKKY